LSLDWSMMLCIENPWYSSPVSDKQRVSHKGENVCGVAHRGSTVDQAYLQFGCCSMMLTNELLNKGIVVYCH
jgi:hypothetical protein